MTNDQVIAIMAAIIDSNGPASIVSTVKRARELAAAVGLGGIPGVMGLRVEELSPEAKRAIVQTIDEHHRRNLQPTAGPAAEATE